MSIISEWRGKFFFNYILFFQFEIYSITTAEIMLIFLKCVVCILSTLTE